MIYFYFSLKLTAIFSKSELYLICLYNPRWWLGAWRNFHWWWWSCR